MKVTIAVKGRFHAFYLARELQERGHLWRLITTYPVFETMKYGVAREKIQSLLVHEILFRAWSQTRLSRLPCNPQYLFHEAFDRHAARHLPGGTQIFVGWSSLALHSLRRARQLGAKTVVERGSSHILHQSRILREEYERLGLKPTLPHPLIVQKELQEYEEADFISIHSAFVKASFLARGVPEGKLFHTPLGVDLTVFQPRPRQDHLFRVIHCGTLSIRKGVPYLLQAFAELNLPRAELWLVGSLTEEIRPFLDKFASPRILHKGPFPEWDLPQYYSQGSVFCLASLEDGFAMVQAQAMACGLPVICTANTGASDLVRPGRDGFIVPIRDVEALKEKMLFFYENPGACQEMGASARQRVQEFTWSDYASKMISAYQQILGPGKS